MRHAIRLFTFSYVALLLIALASCVGCDGAPVHPEEWRADKSHNQYGGYIDACGDLPPLVGDDC
jgi:hypothetical protein